MKKLKKNMLAVMAALSLVVTSFSPVGTYNVQAEESSSPIDLSEINLELDNYRLKYTGETIPYLPIYRYVDSDEDMMLEYLSLGTDYKILGYAVPDGEFFDEDPEPFDDVWIKGIPKDVGTYAILIEGMGKYSNKAVVDISIIDPYDLKNIWAESPDEYNVISYKDIYLYISYFDFEKKEAVYVYPEEDKDFVFEGWCEQEDYADGIRKWSKDKITKEGTYAFKFTGKGEYKGELVVFFDIPDLKAIESYYPYFNQAIKYDLNTKKYDFCFINDYLEEGKDYTLSYCDSDDYDEEYENPEKINWIAGLPNENSKPARNGAFVIRIEGKNSYSGVVYYSYYYYGERNKIKVVDTDKLEISEASTNDNYNLVICPNETKEYTIKVAASGLEDEEWLSISIYDENGSYIKGSYDGDSFEEKVELEAGKIYLIELSASVFGDDRKVSYKMEINGGYKYKEPGSVEVTKIEDKKPEQKVQPVAQDTFKAPAVGTKLADKNFAYKVTKAVVKKGDVGEVEVTGLKKKSLKKINIADKVTIDGNTYNVTSIAKNAFKGNKKVTQVTIGKNVTKIGAGAFANVNKLKKVTIKSTKITKIGKKAFARKKAKKLIFKVNKKNKKAYKKRLKKAKTNKFVVK